MSLLELCNGLTRLTFNRNTMQKAQSSVEGLCTIVDHHYQEILNRVKALERQRFSQASGKLIPSELNNLPRQSKQSAMVYPVDDSVINRSSSNFFHFSFEKDLSMTRLYQKIKFRRSKLSFVSVEEPATRWSTISDLNTIDGVSRLSVLNLAITPVEVYNSSRYTISSTDEPHTYPQPSEEINQTQGQPRNTRRVEVFESFPFSMEDTTHRVLQTALKKYRINADWRQYALYILYRDQEREQERYLGPDEKPLVLFKQLDREGRKPMFMLRRHATPVEGYSIPTSSYTSPAVTESFYGHGLVTVF